MTGRELANHRRRPNNKLPPAAERPIPRPIGCGIDKISYGRFHSPCSTLNILRGTETST